MAGDHGPTCHINRRHLASPDGPPPCHVTDPREALLTASPMLIHVGLIQETTLSCHGLLGPPSFTWEAQTDLQTAILTTATDLIAMQPPPRAIKHRWMARR